MQKVVFDYQGTVEISAQTGVSMELVRSLCTVHHTDRVFIGRVDVKPQIILVGRVGSIQRSADLNIVSKKTKTFREDGRHLYERLRERFEGR